MKNSWGSEEQEFPNRNGWGALNAEGEHTGYFYLSYYDQSIQMLETFDYDLAPYTEAPDYMIDQHNFLIAGNTLVNGYGEPAPSANVFTATEDRTVRTLACETVKPNTTVTYRLYLLDDDAADPTDGTLAAEEEAAYEYGGYHRMALAEDEWVPMREGQRYSVVVTQYCNDDNTYYQSAASNIAKIPEETVAEIHAQLTQMFTETIWNGIYQEAYQANVDAGMPEDEAKAAAEEEANEVIKREEVQDTIESMVNERLAGITSLYYEAKVGEGESFTFDPAEGGSWLDWSDVITNELPTTNVYDNFPIKAFADYRDYAEAGTLKALASLIDEAEADLGSLTVSEDGSDVAPDARWVTQAEHDKLAAAVAAARELLSGAGDDLSTLLLTTPGQQATEDAIAALEAACEEFAASARPGAKAPEQPVAPGDSGGNGILAKTGDPSTRAVTALGCLVALSAAALAGARLSRRRIGR